MKDMKRLFGYMGSYKKDMILGAVFVMIETAFELFIPIMISDLIDIGVAGRDVHYIYMKGVQMALLALGALITGLLYAKFSARASYGWGAEIRKAEYAKVQQYAFSNLDHFVTSSLITRMTTDVNVLQNMIISGFRPITRGPSLLIMGIGLSFWMNPKLAFVFIVCTGCQTPGTKQDEYIECLYEMWKQIELHCSQTDVCVPILGSGLTLFEGESLSQQELLNIMIGSYKLSPHKIKAPYKLRIICKKIDGFTLNEIDA